jgi:hypothetical protein
MPRLHCLRGKDVTVARQLLTDRLILRWWTSDDLDALTAIFARPEVWHFPFQRGWSGEETEQFLRRKVDEQLRRAYCIDMHSNDARAAGETEQRLYALSAWRETAFFTERERAALALTEVITVIADAHVPPADLERAAKESRRTS